MKRHLRAVVVIKPDARTPRIGGSPDLAGEPAEVSAKPADTSSRSCRARRGTIDKIFFYVKTSFRYVRHRLPRPDRAGRSPAQAAADRSAAAARRAPVVHRGGGRAQSD